MLLGRHAAFVVGFSGVVGRLPVLEIPFRTWYAVAYLEGEQLEQARRAGEYVRALATAMEHERALAQIERIAEHLPRA